PVRVDRRVAPVGGDQIMQVSLWIAPFPRGDDDVAFNTLRPWRLGVRQLALGDAIGPITEVLEWGAPKISGQGIHHQGCGLSRLYPTNPGLFPRLELAKRARDRARCKLPQLMTPHARPVFDHGQPLRARNFLGDVALAAELVRGGDLEHRIPIYRRIVARRIGRGGRPNRDEVEVRSGLA